MFEMVEAMGLFIERADVDKGFYVYRPLFRAMVLRRLKHYDPDRAFALHRRASMHFAAHGRVWQWSMPHKAAIRISLRHSSKMSPNP